MCVYSYVVVFMTKYFIFRCNARAYFLVEKKGIQKRTENRRSTKEAEINRKPRKPNSTEGQKTGTQCPDGQAQHVLPCDCEREQCGPNFGPSSLLSRPCSSRQEPHYSQKEKRQEPHSSKHNNHTLLELCFHSESHYIC
jgi:hypothetical protein